MDSRTFSATLKIYRGSPRKVRLVADSIRGKKVGEARIILDLLNKRAADPIQKLLKSAVANAKGLAEEESLFVKKIAVDKGPILYRRRFRARGRVMPIRKRTSHVVLELGSKEK